MEAQKMLMSEFRLVICHAMLQKSVLSASLHRRK
jgi:hypothetical protein